MRVLPELLEYKQWVLWRKTEVNGRITKVPVSPWSGKAAACDKPQTWGTYRHVLYALRRFRVMASVSFSRMSIRFAGSTSTTAGRSMELSRPMHWT